MKILSIDTSTIYLSLAVSDGDKVIAKLHKKAPMSHSSLLVPMIDKLLKKARLKLKDIAVFCISIGPGSFTGLRIGVATIKVLSYTLKKPVVAVPTLDVIAENAKRFKGVICPVLDARKNKVYACIYKSDGKGVRKISKYLLLPVKELKEKLKKFDKILFLGDALGLMDEKEKIKNWHPRAEVASRICLGLIKKKKFTRPEDLEPLYLYSRECDIKGI